MVPILYNMKIYGAKPDAVANMSASETRICFYKNSPNAPACCMYLLFTQSADVYQFILSVLSITNRYLLKFDTQLKNLVCSTDFLL